jgi:hypothetical protein
MRQFCILLIFSLASCSVKKQSAKLIEDTKTEVETITKTTRQDSIKYDSDTYEILIEQKDSLKPISVVLNGVESTFKNAKSVTIRKKKESIKTHLNEQTEILKDSVVSKKVEERLFEKDKSFDYKSVYPILFVLAFFVLLRIVLKQFSIF